MVCFEASPEKYRPWKLEVDGNALAWSWTSRKMPPCIPVYETGKIAGWIAPPGKGINGHPFDFEYIKFRN